MQETWSKFHQRHGSEAPKAINGSFITDMRQYETHKRNTAATKRKSIFTLCISCLTCLCGVRLVSAHAHGKQGADDMNMFS